VQGLPAELAADVGRVKRFILAIRESMYDNAYHNFYHVFDVTQTVSPSLGELLRGLCLQPTEQ